MSSPAGRTPGSVLATIAGGLGVVAVLALTVWALVVGDDPPPETLEHVTFGVILGGPFAVSLLVLRSRSSRLSGGIWIGAGLVGAATPFAIFSFVGLFFVPLHLALVVAGALALAATREERGAVVVPIVGLFVTAALAIGVVNLLRDSACWQRVGDTWESKPFSGEVSAEGFLGPGETVTSGVCGQFVTVPGAAVAIGAWVVAGAGFGFAAGRPLEAPA